MIFQLQKSESTEGFGEMLKKCSVEMWLVITHLGGGKPRNAYENYRFIVRSKSLFECCRYGASLVMGEIGTWVIFPAASRPALGPTQKSNWLLPGTFFFRAKRLWGGTDHSSPSSVQVQNVRNYNSTPPYMSIERCLIKHRNIFSDQLLTKHYFFGIFLSG